MKNLTAQTQKIQAIPSDKHDRKLWQTAGGVGIAGIGFALPLMVPAFPVWFAMIVVGFGFFVMSKELLTKYAGFIPAAIRDVINAVRGKE